MQRRTFAPGLRDSTCSAAATCPPDIRCTRANSAASDSPRQAGPGSSSKWASPMSSLINESAENVSSRGAAAAHSSSATSHAVAWSSRNGRASLASKPGFDGRASLASKPGSGVPAARVPLKSKSNCSRMLAIASPPCELEASAPVLFASPRTTTTCAMTCSDMTPPPSRRLNSSGSSD
eukprot:365325-Chlamydomonas_euryale.AAC.33